MSNHKSLVRIAQVFFLSLVFAALVPAVAFASTTTIEPSGDKTGYTDTHAIQDAINSGAEVVLQDGATYYTKSNLKVKSGTKITATGATIIAVATESGAFRNDVLKNRYNYNSCKNVKVTGGYWKHVSKNGFKHSLIQFTHASNIVLKDMTVEGSFDAHAIEFIGCKNITVDGCTVKSIGKGKSTSVEEGIQFDVASPATAPTVKKNFGAKAVNGQTCQNVKVNNCKVIGSRGISTNYTTKDPAYMGKCHKNISITNCTVVGTTSEAIILFNAVGKLNVKNNTIVSYSPRTKVAYSVGLHFALFGKVAKSQGKSIKATVTGNTIKGGRQGMFVCSHSSGTRMGSFTVKNNKVYAQAGKAQAIWNTSTGATKFTQSKNKTYKWAKKDYKKQKAASLKEFAAIAPPEPKATTTEETAADTTAAATTDASAAAATTDASSLAAGTVAA